MKIQAVVGQINEVHHDRFEVAICVRDVLKTRFIQFFYLIYGVGGTIVLYNLWVQDKLSIQQYLQIVVICPFLGSFRRKTVQPTLTKATIVSFTLI